MNRAVASRPADATKVAKLFHALSDATRVELLQMLRGGERCVCELQGTLDAAQSRLSFHLKVLKDAGLVTGRRDGRWSYYTINDDMLQRAHDLVRELATPRGRAAVPVAKGATAAKPSRGLRVLGECCG